MLYDKSKYETETLKEHNGPIESMQTTMKTAPFAHPEVIWKDKLMTADLYHADDAGNLMMIMYCPKCLNMLTIKQGMKQMHWDGQNISVERFKCSWEADNSAPVGTISFGMNLCNWEVGIEKGRAIDARKGK